VQATQRQTQVNMMQVTSDQLHNELQLLWNTENSISKLTKWQIIKWQKNA